ncbi:MAG: flagellar basal body protein FliL [Micavibrio sp.]|nr:flagellar basal body protein FliL [Micavibrio sp.]
MSDDDVNETEVDPDESAETEGEDEGSEGKAGFNAKKLIIFVVIPLLLLLGVGGGLYFSGFLDPYLGGGEECVEEVDDHGEVITACPEEESQDKAEADHGSDGDDGHGGGGDGHGEGGSGAFIEMPTMIVNLSEEDGTPRFLRLTVQLELENPDEASQIEAVMPRVVDQFQTYLRELRVKDLRGSAGIYRLQMELLWRVNQASAPVKVKDVLFQEILIQ